MFVPSLVWLTPTMTDTEVLNYQRAKDLIVELFAGGEPAHRDEIAQRVLKTHMDRGGKPNKQLTDFIGTTLGKLEREDDLAKFLLLGKAADCRWKILESRTEAEAIGPSIHQRRLQKLSSLDAEIVMGVGEESVYAFCYKSHRIAAESNQSLHWPIKIGMTKSDYRTRIWDQVKTNTHEQPVVELLLRTDRADVWERLLHSILTEAGRHKSDISTQTEWFFTNPKELQSLIDELGGIVRRLGPKVG